MNSSDEFSPEPVQGGLYVRQCHAYRNGKATMVDEIILIASATCSDDNTVFYCRFYYNDISYGAAGYSSSITEAVWKEWCELNQIRRLS